MSAENASTTAVGTAGPGSTRVRRDRCPGVLRPWPADDGLLVRLRLIGGHVPISALRRLLEVSHEYGDGRIRVTGRANLQLRALPRAAGGDPVGRLPERVLRAIEATGLLPTRSHELVRNVMVSPQTGLAGGRADLRPIAAQLEAALCARPRLAALPGRFLFVLDDGRGDLLERTGDLGLVALDPATAQLRIGEGFGAPVPLSGAAAALADLAVAFLDQRGEGPQAAWHIVELTAPQQESLGSGHPADARLPVPIGPLAFGEVPGGVHLQVTANGMDDDALSELESVAAGRSAAEVVVTPWRGILVPGRTPDTTAPTTGMTGATR